jgi:hypothetical protein
MVENENRYDVSVDGYVYMEVCCHLCKYKKTCTRLQKCVELQDCHCNCDPGLVGICFEKEDF